MTVCDLLQDYDSAVRPSGKTPMNDQSMLVHNELDNKLKLIFLWMFE